MLWAGPFEIDVVSDDQVVYRDLKPSEIRQSHLKYFTHPAETVLDRISVRILPAMEKLAPAPAGAIELEKNWRVWELPDGRLQLQIYSGTGEEYSLEARIRRDLRDVEIVTVVNHPSRNVLEFMVQTVLIWMISQLAVTRGGFLLHCASVQFPDGSVVIGCGPSGAGKSTFSRYFVRREGYRVLSDETTMLIRQDGRFYAFGTPWPGMLSKGLNAGGPLRQIFLLEKTPAHVIREIPRSEAALRVLREIFLPPWSAEVTEASLSSLEACLEAVPCGALGFKKSGTVVSFLEENL